METLNPNSQAFSLLSSILVSGTSQSNTEHQLPTYIPAPQYLSLAGTLIVHPSQTTRAASADANRAANDALNLLRLVNVTVGTVNADLATAFAFASPTKGRFRGWRSGTKPAPPSRELDDGAVNTDIATKGSIWQRAEDFWHVVGWAFNCSLAWKKRWERWKLWLDFMVDTLNEDFDERLRQAKDAQNGHDAQDLLKESLILQYLLPCETRTGRRRIMRAIFADGDTKAKNEFKQIFKNETKERTSEEAALSDRKVKKLNIDQGEFADYVDDDDEDEKEEQVKGTLDTQTRDDKAQSLANSGQDSPIEILESSPDESEWPGKDGTNGMERLGGMDSIFLRQRLLALLAKVAESTPAYFTTLDDLLDLYTEFIRSLSTPLFSIFVAPSTPYLSNRVQSCLSRTLLRPLLGLSDRGNDTTPLDQTTLENDYLLCQANSTTVSDNAKVSLLMEVLLRNLLNSGSLRLTTSLQQTIEWGIEARQKSAEWDGRKRTSKKQKAEEWSEMVLSLSAARISAIVDALSAGKDKSTFEVWTKSK
ncbi:MAG: hypothetical protein M1822_000328 [Bathelium mastoideum]|nr:MAG: hypothetical protein M1822_000328 [Bathelium mastoideum]